MKLACVCVCVCSHAGCVCACVYGALLQIYRASLRKYRTLSWIERNAHVHSSVYGFQKHNNSESVEKKRDGWYRENQIDGHL